MGWLDDLQSIFKTSSDVYVAYEEGQVKKNVIYTLLSYLPLALILCFLYLIFKK